MKSVAMTLLLALPLFAVEDPKLRQAANEITNRSTAASTAATWPPNHRETHFRYTDNNDVSTEGTVSFDYQGPYTRRIEITFGNFHGLKVEGPNAEGASNSEPLFPPGVREMQKLTPVYLISFDKEDIIQEIRESTVQGRPARCIFFQSNFGSRMVDGEACYDKATGVFEHFRFGGQVVDSSNWVQFAGVWIPTHIEESENGRRIMVIDQTITPVDSFPADTFTLPPGVLPYVWCHDWRRPTGLHMPQPSSGPGDNVEDIAVQVRIESDGRSTYPAIRHSNRPDLNEEALKIASQWTFRPATCDGKVAPSQGDFVLHFKGR